MTTPRDDAPWLPWFWTADTEDDDNWLAEFSGEDIRALVRERNRLLAALGAEAETPDHAFEPMRDANDLTCSRCLRRHPAWVDLASPETAEALAGALDHHWMDYIPESRTAICTCGQWQFDSERDIEPGEHFAPFSRHCAEASLAAMRETGR